MRNVKSLGGGMGEFAVLIGDSRSIVANRDVAVLLRCLLTADGVIPDMF